MAGCWSQPDLFWPSSPARQRIGFSARVRHLERRAPSWYLVHIPCCHPDLPRSRFVNMTTEKKPLGIEYPETDGLPVAENTVQFEYIATIKGGLDARFSDFPDVFVAGDLF